MDMLTLEVLASNEPGAPVTKNGPTFLHAACCLALARDGDLDPAWVAGAQNTTYGFATGKQCLLCRGFFGG